MKSKVVIILGMHRSGTSCLAGSLQDHGLYLGDVKTYSPFNIKGNRENPDIFNMQEKLFNQYGGGWTDPPKELLISLEEKNRFQTIVESFSSHGLWGFKDPRTLFTLHIWLEVLKAHDVKLVASFRHPLAVACSLLGRNQFPLEKGFDLWLRYNMKLLSYCQRYSVNLINFDLPAALYQEQLLKIIHGFGLPAGPEQNFYNEELIHHEMDEVILDERIEEVYQKLLILSEPSCF